MIVRIVKMTFATDKVNDFLKLFAEVKTKISSFEGCRHLELMQDINSKNIFFNSSSVYDASTSLALCPLFLSILRSSSELMRVENRLSVSSI